MVVGVTPSCNAGYAFCGADNQYYDGNPAYRDVAEGANGPALELADGLNAGVDLFNFDVYFVDAAEFVTTNILDDGVANALVHYGLA